MKQDNDKSDSAEEKKQPKPWWRQSCPELLANVYLPFKVILFPFALAGYSISENGITRTT